MKIRLNRYSISILMGLTCLFYSCQESMEDKAAREAWDYTRKFCPTPFVNHIRTDRVVFDKKTMTFTYYCTFNDILDNQETIDANKQKIRDCLRASVRESTSMKPYIEAGYHFRYVCSSEKVPNHILIDFAM